MNLTPTNRAEATKQLLNCGFRVSYSNENITVLCKPNGQNMQIAMVDDNGNVNTHPLSEFLETILN